MTLSVIALHCRLSPRARRPYLRDGEGHFYFRVCSHALTGLVGDIIVQIVCKAKGFRLPAAGGIRGGVFHLSVPERSGLALIHVVHLQHKAIGQGVASADLPDQGLADDLCFQFIKQFLVDGALDLLPCKTASGLEAEDIGRLAALERLLPDAHGGPHADISLPHGKLFLERQSREVFTLRPAVHHPFAFDLHDVFLVSVFMYLF